MPTIYTKAVISSKLEDRFLTTQVIEPEPDKQAMGTLFSLVEINRPWYPNAQIAQAIINTLKREYYKGKSTSDLENLEQALKKVNETLARITETGETDWIGHLSAVIALEVEKQLHLASSGNARGYLLRAGKLAEVSEPAVRAEEPNPMATFGSIISGELQPDDVLLVGSPGLFEHFDKTSLKELLSEQSTYQAASNIVKRLPRDKRKTLNFMVLSANPGGQEPEPPVIYLDDPFDSPGKAVSEFVAKTLLPTLQVAAQEFGKATAKAAKYLEQKVLPETKRVAKYAYEQTRAQAGPLVKQTLEKTKTKFKAVTKEEPVEKPSLIGKHLFTIHDYQPKTKQAKFGLPQVKLPTLKVSPASYERVASLGHNVLLRSKNLIKDARAGKRRFALTLLGALILALILIVSISVQRSRAGTKVRFGDQKEQLTQAKRQAEEGKTALIFGQQAQAQKLFAEALEGARFASSHNKLREEALSVISEVEGQLDKLTSTTRFKDIKPLLELGQLAGMAEFDNKIWGFNESGNLVSANLLEASLDQAASAEKAVKVVVATKQDDKLIGLTSETQLVLAKLKDKTVKILPALEGAELKPGKDLKTFAGNLYLLDSDANQIWRYPISDEGYKPGSGFFRKGPGLGNAVAMAIDGSIYVLRDDGKVDKYLKGEKQAFNLSVAPKPDDTISQPKKIFADTDSLSIFILDNVKDRPRLLEYGKDGKYIHSYVFSLPSVDDLYLTPRGRKAWILSGGKLYEVNL